MRRRIRASVPSDAWALASRLLPEHLAELEAVDPLMLLPAEALQQALAGSAISRTLVLGGVPEAVWGVKDCGGGRGMIWMLGAARVAEDRRWFLAESRRQVEQLESGFTEVYNFVDDRYVAALRWLAWLGFQCIGSGVSQWSGLSLSLMVRRVGDDGYRAGADRHDRRSGRDRLLRDQQAQGAQGAGGTGLR